MSTIEEEFRRSVHGPYNAAFQAAFQKRKIARKFFRHYFPKELVKLMDFRTLKLANRSFVDEEMKSRHSDIVYTVNIRERFVEAAAFLGTIDDEKTQLEFLELMIRYVYHARDDDREYIDQGLDALKNEQARRLAMTIAERLRQEGLENGRTKTGGIILMQMKKRFGSISPFLEQKLMQSDFDNLGRFGESIFEFNSLKDAEKWWEDCENDGNA